jgi:hypothetical protein
MQDPHPAAGWWGYAEANRTLVGLVVGLVVVAAIAFLVRRFWRR